MIAIPSVRSVSTRSPETNVLIIKTTQSSGTFGDNNAVAVTHNKSISSNIKVEWWDGTTSTYTGNSFGLVNISKAISSPYDTSSEKTIKIYTVNAGGQRVDAVTEFAANNYFPTGAARFLISDINFKGCVGFKSLFIFESNPAISHTISPENLNFDGHTAIETFYINRVNPSSSTSVRLRNCKALKSFNIITCSNITSVDVNLQGSNGVFQLYSMNGLESVTVSGGVDSQFFINPGSDLDELTIDNANPSSISVGSYQGSQIYGLNTLGGNLQTFSLLDTAIESVDLPFTSFPLLRNVTLANNSQLTSVRLVGQSFATYKYISSYYFDSGVSLLNCNLDSTALDQVYTDLATSTGTYGAYLIVTGNPGTTGDNPSIATNKNYTVVGS